MRNNLSFSDGSVDYGIFGRRAADPILFDLAAARAQGESDDRVSAGLLQGLPVVAIRKGQPLAVEDDFVIALALGSAVFETSLGSDREHYAPRG